MNDHRQTYPPSPYRAPLNTAQSLNVILASIIIGQLLIIGFLVSKI